MQSRGKMRVSKGRGEKVVVRIEGIKWLVIMHN
jgi:hypothetical protein